MKHIGNLLTTVLYFIFLCSSGVTFPSGEMQRRLVQSLYEEVNISPEQVEYIEAHGTGTKVCAYKTLVFGKNVSVIVFASEDG